MKLTIGNKKIIAHWYNDNVLKRVPWKQVAKLISQGHTSGQFSIEEFSGTKLGWWVDVSSLEYSKEFAEKQCTQWE